MHRPISTARLELVPVALDDVDALWPFVSDPELPRWMTWAAHRDRAETAGFVTRMMAAANDGQGCVWTLRHEGALCGVVGLHDVTRIRLAWRMDRAELGYWCGTSTRNRGLITEAARAVIRFGFEDLSLHKIAVGCATQNVASKRVIDKLGFRLVGEQRDHFFRDGQWWHHLEHEMLVDEWRKSLGDGAQAG